MATFLEEEIGMAPITPEMLMKARVIYSTWMDRWDYLLEGTPHQDEIDGLLLRLMALNEDATRRSNDSLAQTGS